MLTARRPLVSTRNRSTVSPRPRTDPIRISSAPGAHPLRTSLLRPLWPSSRGRTFRWRVGNESQTPPMWRRLAEGFLRDVARLRHVDRVVGTVTESRQHRVLDRLIEVDTVLATPGSWPAQRRSRDRAARRLAQFLAVSGGAALAGRRSGGSRRHERVPARGSSPAEHRTCGSR